MLWAQDAQLQPRGRTPDAPAEFLKVHENLLYVGGDFSKVGYFVGGTGMLKLGEQTPDLRFPTTYSGSFPYANGNVQDVLPDGFGGYYVGGSFSRFDSKSISNLGHVLPDMEVDQAFPLSTNGQVRSLGIWNDTMMVAGAFTEVNGNAQPYFFAFNNLTYAQYPIDLGLDGAVNEVRVKGDTLILAGTFSRILGVNQQGIARLQLPGMTLINTPSITVGAVLDLDLEGNTLYAAGSFTGEVGRIGGRLGQFFDNDEDNNPAFPTAAGEVEVIVPDGNGGWYVGGSFTSIGGSGQDRVAHILANNTVDPAFDFAVNSTVRAITFWNDTMMIGGAFTTIDGQPRSRLAAIDLSNNTLMNWAPEADNQVFDLKSDANYIYVAGSFDEIDGDHQPGLAVLSRSTLESIPVPCPPSGQVNTMVFNDTIMFAGGTFTGDAGYFTGKLAMFQGSNSQPDLDKLSVEGDVNAIIPDGNGGWYVGGNFFSVNGDNSFRRLIHLDPNGQLDQNFFFNFNGAIEDLGIWNDTMMVVGAFTSIDGQSRNRMAAIGLGSQTLLPFNPDFSSTIYTLNIFNDTIMVVGNFTTVNGQTRNRAASIVFDGGTGTVTNWDPSPNSAVYALAPYGNRVIIGGAFTNLNGTSYGRMAMVDRVNGTPVAWNPNLNNAVYAMQVDGSSLFVGGSFTQADGTARNRLASYDLTTQTLTGFDPGADNWVEAIFSFQDSLFVGGRFGNIGGQSRNYLAVLNKQTGVPYAWNPNLDDYVYAIHAEAGHTLIGGRFDLAEAVPRTRLYALNRTTLEATDWAPIANSTVEDMAVWNDTIMVVGAFTQINGQPRQRIARVSALDGVESPWSPEADNTVYSIAQRGDSVLIGGRFDWVNGLPYPNLAALDIQTGSPFPWQPEPGSDVNAVAVQGNQVVVGGAFSTFQTKLRNRALAINMTSGLVTDWDPDAKGFFSPSVEGIEATPNAVYLAGGFGSVGDSSRANFAAVNTTNGEALAWNPIFDDNVKSMRVWNDTIFVVGGFTEVNGVPRQHAAALDISTEALTNWAPRPNDPPSRLRIFQDSLMVILGQYGYLDARSRRYAYSVDLLTDSITNFAPDIIGNLYDMLVTPEGDKVWMASWSSINNKKLYAVEPVNGDSIPGFSHNTDDQILDIAYEPFTRTLYFVGEFTQVDGQTRNHIAAVDSLGNLTSFSLDVNDDIWGLDVIDTTIYIAGTFTSVNGEVRDGLAAVNVEGDLLKWAPEPGNGFARGIVARQDRILIRGTFTLMNGKTRYRTAAVHPITGRLYDWDPVLTGGGVNRLFPTSEGMMIGGSFQYAAGTLTPGLSFVSERSGRQLVKLPFFVDVDAVATYDSTLYVAQPREAIDGKVYPYLSRVNFAFAPFNARIETLEPNSGGNTGDVTLRIKGNGFTKNTRVFLIAPGMNPIRGVDSATITYGGTYLETTMILRNQPPGVRDVVIRIPGDTTIVLPGAFTVNDGGEAKPYADVLVPPLVRAGRPFSVFVFYGNNGDIDAHGVPLWMALSENLEVSQIGLEERILVDTAESWVDSLSGFFPLDTLGRRPFAGKAKAYIIPRISAGDSRMVRLVVVQDSNGTYRVAAWANEGMFGSPLKGITGECLAAIIEQAIGFVPSASCVYGLFSAITCPLYDAYTNPDYGTAQDAANWALSTGGTVAGCVGDAVTGGTASIILFILEQLATAKGIYDLAEACFPPGEDDPDEGEVSNSLDPNDKVGPGGNGGLRWLTTERDFPYMIRFENDTSATLPAQIVTIRDTLDLNVYDLSSLKLVSFTIGKQYFTFPLESKHSMTVVDLNPDVDALVRVEADLDNQTGEMVWTFTTLDRETFEPTEDPIAGFLPPNDDGVSGTGAVTFLIRVKDGTATGTEIGNRASIVFDTNEPIITNRWTNIADNDAPTSMVESLPDTTYSATFQVNWSGSDMGAGIRYYRLYFSEDGGPYEAGSLATADTFATFTGTPGSTYDFYTIAVDTAMNEELAPITADATTLIAEGASGLFDKVGVTQSAITIFPNPNSGSFNLAITASQPGVLRYRVLDLMGRQIMANSESLGIGAHQFPVQLSKSSGIYLIEYEFNGLKGSERVVVR